MSAACFVYDAGPLVAAERSDRAFWLEHRLRLVAGNVVAVPSVVIAQVSRSGRQVQLRRLLRACEVVAFDEEAAHRAGALLGKSRTRDVADAAVVVLAERLGARIVTSDRDDIERLVAATGSSIRVVDT